MFHTREGAPSGLRQRTLFSERYVLVGRVGHPKLHAADAGAILPIGAGDGLAGRRRVLWHDRQGVGGRGLTRRVVLSVPHFLFVISVLTQSDLVAMLPERLVRNQPLLQRLEPLAVPGFEMTMLWHERSIRIPLTDGCANISCVQCERVGGLKGEAFLILSIGVPSLSGTCGKRS